MFSSRPWSWLALCIAGVLVFIGASSADAGLVGTQAMTNTCPVFTQVAVSPMKASVGGDRRGRRPHHLQLDGYGRKLRGSHSAEHHLYVRSGR
jgi:hypothetical protein